MDLDAIIAEAVQDTAIEQTAAPIEEAAETPTKEQTEQEEKDISQKRDDELTPEQLAKRERNRESKLNSKLAEMRRLNRSLQEQLAQGGRPAPETKPDLSKEPDPSSPEWKDKPWGEFTRAHNSWLVDQKFNENTRRTQEIQSQQAFESWKGQQAERIDQRLPQLRESIPDIENVLEEIESFASLLTPQQARIALEAEDINLAAYTLHREGKLQDVMKLPPSQMAAAIAKAEVRGQQYLNPPKTVTNAPAPLTASRGNGTAGKDLSRMSADELYDDWFKKK